MAANKSTDSDILIALQQDVKMLLHELDELKKILAVKNAQDDTFRDLIIDYLVNKKDIKIGDVKTAVVSSSTTKIPRVKKSNDNVEIIDVFHKNMYDFLKQNKDTHFDFVEAFNKTNINNMGDKLTDNSANNVKNCFIWCYSHINDVRIEVLDLSNVEVYANALYTDKNELIKHNKTLTDLLKYEGSEVFKKYKEDTSFKKYCESLKMKYKKLLG
jgi:hypothetical protein